jgi:predicted small lipoprotein YifL
MIRVTKIVGTTALLALAGLTLAGCGKFGPLEPRAGAKPAPLAYGQNKTADTDAFTAASVQARPGRSDELLRRSERRGDDPFDLPPGSDGNVVKSSPKPDKDTPIPVPVPDPKLN